MVGKNILLAALTKDPNTQASFLPLSRIRLYFPPTVLSGIFIKNVLEGSPAGVSGQLCTGDRILAVDQTDLRNASHDEAVDVIRQSGQRVLFIVQSLLGVATTNTNTETSATPTVTGGEGDGGADGDRDSPSTTPNSDVMTAEEEDEALVTAVPPPQFANDPSPPPPPPLEQEPAEPLAKAPSVESSEEVLPPVVEMTGQITLPNGVTIDKNSAAYLPQVRTESIEEGGHFFYPIK